MKLEKDPIRSRKWVLKSADPDQNFKIHEWFSFFLNISVLDMLGVDTVKVTHLK